MADFSFFIARPDFFVAQLNFFTAWPNSSSAERKLLPSRQDSFIAKPNCFAIEQERKKNGSLSAATCLLPSARGLYICAAD
ncbi:hypothetical protein [Candidatus Electronema sp. TJ]|uniref:hypothetical protein n=1 Tax=Candidatus Electronema sp. TJ TaxID=3401573 RepID=UPI003AA7FC5E